MSRLRLREYWQTLYVSGDEEVLKQDWMMLGGVLLMKEKIVDADDQVATNLFLEEEEVGGLERPSLGNGTRKRK
jgi:hypothetical protein